MLATMMLRRLSSLRRRCFSFSNASDFESVAYSKSMYRRPPTVKLKSLGPFHQNVSNLIGTIVSPVKSFDQNTDRIYTSLDVDRPKNNKPLRVGLQMRGKIAEQSQRYLKLGDYVSVRGFLVSYEKVDENGRVHVNYKVHVNILNYVQPQNQNVSSQQQDCSFEEGDMSTFVALDQQSVSSSSETIVTEQDPEEERRERLYLWGVYFGDPGVWWDNRNDKKYPKAPDFKHKDTRECLWLRPDDPPWIQKQLQLNDSRMVTGYQGATKSRPSFDSQWDL